MRAAHVAQELRNARSLTPEDIIFVIRRDPVKVLRLKEFLSWKDLRKNAKTGDDTAGTGTLDGAEDEFMGISQIEAFSGGDPPTTMATSVGGRPPALSKVSRRKQARLPWDLLSGMVAELMRPTALAGATTGEASVDLLAASAVNFTNGPSGPMGGGVLGLLNLDEDETIDADAHADATRRLQLADEMTREMSREEYMEYSECRQASFTYKKAKKFRDWLNPAQFIDYRLSDDVVEILGFLAWDMVRLLTERALAIKAVYDRKQKLGKMTAGSGTGRSVGSPPAIGSAMRGGGTPVTSDVPIGGIPALDHGDGLPPCTLFASPSEKTAITPQHLHVAIAQLHRAQTNPLRALLPASLTGGGGGIRKSLRLY